VRTLAIMVLILALGTGSASADASAGPPVIREPFTVLPCPAHPVTTLDSQGCSERALVRSDRMIDAQAKRVFGLLPSSKARATFVRGESSWLDYRRTSCTAVSSKYEGGSVRALVFLECELQRNATHLVDLKQMVKALEFD